MQNYSLFSKHPQFKKQASSIFQIYTFISIDIGGRLSYYTCELTRYTSIFNHEMTLTRLQSLEVLISTIYVMTASHKCPKLEQMGEFIVLAEYWVAVKYIISHLPHIVSY